MRNLLFALIGVPALTGCVFHRHRISAQQPVYAPPPVQTTYGWNHVRWCVWTEYYGCTEEEMYALERSGYDDDDVLVLCHIARHARVPVRTVAYEYDRCDRSLYTTAMAFRVDPVTLYCRELPREATCPAPYGRVYASYWRGERPFLTNDECRALVHLQIGVRYYGYTHAAYFRDYDRCRSRNEHPFRSVAVRDYSRCGAGGRTVQETVVVKKEKPWDAGGLKVWEKKREVEREKVKTLCTPQKEKEEHEKTRQAAEAPDRKAHVQQVRLEATALKVRRDETDARHPVDGREKPAPAGTRSAKIEPPRVPERTPVPAKKAEAAPEPRPVLPRSTEARKVEPPPRVEARKPAPSPEPPRRAEERSPAPPPEPPKRVEARRPAPPPEPPRRIEERRSAPAAPPRIQEKRAAPAPERKSEERKGGDSRKK